MKKLTLILVICLTAYIAQSQSLHSIPYYKWSNAMTFKAGPSPSIKGMGVLSDSLATAYEAQQAYIYNGEYYLISSWADYYLWYTTKYWFQFESPELYQFHYYNKDNYNMVKYIAGSFNGAYYPSKISVFSEDDTRLAENWLDKRLPDSQTKQARYYNKINNQAKRNINPNISNKLANGNNPTQEADIRNSKQVSDGLNTKFIDKEDRVSSSTTKSQPVNYNLAKSISSQNATKRIISTNTSVTKTNIKQNK